MRLKFLDRQAVLRAMVWLRRVRHTRGFGVQSPWAYGFIRYVINEHYPYYAYEELGSAYPSLGARDRRLALLYFRIANYLQARSWALDVREFEAKAAYIKAGCRKAQVCDMAGEAMGGTSHPDVALVSIKDGCRLPFSSFARRAHSRSLLIVEDIHASKDALRLWREIRESEQTGVCFDLYYCGLVFFDKQMYKQSYTVNF